MSAREVVQHGMDRRALIWARRIGEAARDLAEPVRRRPERRRLGGEPRRLPLGQALRRPLQLGFDLAALASPGLAADPVEAAARFAIPPDAVQLVRGDQQLDPAGELQRYPILVLDRPEPGQPAHAVLKMHHRVAGPGGVVARRQRGAGAWAQQGPDRHDQQPGRPQPDLRVRLEHGDLARRGVGPAVGHVRREPTPLQACGHALRVARRCDHHAIAAGGTDGLEQFVDPTRRLHLFVGHAAELHFVRARGFGLGRRQVELARARQVAGAGADPAGLGGRGVGVVDRLAHRAPALRDFGVAIDRGAGQDLEKRHEAARKMQIGRALLRLRIRLELRFGLLERVAVDGELDRGPQHQALDRLRAAQRDRVVAGDLGDALAVQQQPGRLGRAGREDVDHLAAQRDLALLVHPLVPNDSRARPVRRATRRGRACRRGRAAVRRRAMPRRGGRAAARRPRWSAAGAASWRAAREGIACSRAAQRPWARARADGTGSTSQGGSASTSTPSAKAVASRVTRSSRPAPRRIAIRLPRSAACRSRKRARAGSEGEGGMKQPQPGPTCSVARAGQRPNLGRHEHAVSAARVAARSTRAGAAFGRPIRVDGADDGPDDGRVHPVRQQDPAGGPSRCRCCASATRRHRP